MEETQQKPVYIQLGARMALLVLGVALCLTSAGILIGARRYSKMQLAGNEETGHDIGRAVACLMDQEDVVAHISDVKRIYESAPAELRDTPADPEANYRWSEEEGPYIDLFTSVQTADYEENRYWLSKTAEDLRVVDIGIIFPDIEKNRFVFVMSAVGGEKYKGLYSPTGYWTEVSEDMIAYAKSGDPEQKGLFKTFDLGVGSATETTRIMSSITPFFDPDTGETTAYIIVDRLWSDLDSDRLEFLSGFLLVSGLITILLVLVSEFVLNVAIMRPLKRIAIEQARMTTELNVASDIQLSLLPNTAGEAFCGEDYHIFGVLQSAKEVGGDFYDYFAIDEDHVGIVIGDVVGKGVPASLFSMEARAFIRMSAMNGHSPGEVLEQANNMLCENNAEAMFATAWFGIYTISDSTLCYANAGHDDPAVYSKGEDGTAGWRITPEEHDFALGIVGGMPYMEHTVSLVAGEKILIYTDGVPEAQEAGKELYGEERFIRCLNAAADKSGNDLFAAIFADIDDYTKHAPRFDDITMVLIEF